LQGQAFSELKLQVSELPAMKQPLLTQISPAPHEPQSIVPPQPSEKLPHCLA
jgi:hypothetical protein